MLQRGAPISAKTKNGLAPLHMASQGDHVDAGRILLHHKVSVRLSLLSVSELSVSSVIKQTVIPASLGATISGMLSPVETDCSLPDLDI